MHYAGMTSNQNTRADRVPDKFEKYRQDVRRTFQSMSDQALSFQSARIVGGIDREEIDREMVRRIAEQS